MRQPLTNRQAGLKRRQRSGQVTLGFPHVADPLMADREVALPLGIGRVLLRQPLTNRQAGLKRRQRAGQVTLGLPHVADPLMANR